MKKTLQLVFLLTLIFLLPCRAEADARPTADIAFDFLDEAVESQMAKHGLPGVALAVVAGDEVVYLKGYGSAGEQAMTPQTQMFIGSQSKSFTGFIIAQLAEQGRIDLNAPVQTYIPWFRVADEKASSKITINHLLHHTSGLSDSGFSRILPPDLTSEEATRALADASVTALPGTEFQYFNLGYAVLQYIIEIVTGQTYADILRASVLDPLGMADTTANPAESTSLSRGYTRLFGVAVPMTQPVRDYEIGAGYIVSTAEDMARYALAMKNGGAGLVSPEMFRMMLRPGRGDYGFGWFITDGGSKVFHGGANEAFGMQLSIYPRADRAFVLLVNEGSQVDHFISRDQLTRTVEAIVLGNPPVPVSEGWSVRWIGWGIGILVIALLVMHGRSFYRLFNGWSEKASGRSPLKLAWDVAFSFLLPTLILIVVFSQVGAFYGNRFNLYTSLAYMRYGLPDIFFLMLVGTVPDYTQGVIKLYWAIRRKDALERRRENVGR